MHKFKISFFSIHLLTQVNVNVMIPYPNMNNEKGQVLWALHPALKGADFYFDELGLGRIVDSKNIAIVSPECGNSFFVDSDSNKIATFIQEELRSYIETMLSSVYSSNLEMYGIGISMGAYGLYNWFLNAPSFFKSVNLISGLYSFDIKKDERLKKYRSQKYLIRLIENKKNFIFNKLDDKKSCDLISKTSEMNIVTRTKVLLYCGSSDFISLSSTEELSKVLLQKGIQSELFLADGEHNLEYWTSACDHIISNLL